MTDRIYALDFDGVICDSALETALSAWQTARTFDPDLPELLPTTVLDDFRRVRPVLETGYEAVLICYGLYQGETAEDFLHDFAQQIATQIALLKTDTTAVKAAFAACRDAWIQRDFKNWITMNPLYPGIVEVLQTVPAEHLYIITTKQERFVKAILQAQSLSVEAAHIFGLDRQLKKTQVLAQISKTHPLSSIFFVEDRLPTLQNVMADPALEQIALGFADWGYNTLEDKNFAASQPRIHLLHQAADILLYP